MSNNILESDWKRFKPLYSVALGRFCDRVLAEIAKIAADGDMDSHQRYVAIYKLIQRRDEEIAYMFNGFSRSMAVRQLAAIQVRDLLTPEEMAGFSEELRETLRHVVEFFKGDR